MGFDSRICESRLFWAYVLQKDRLFLKGTKNSGHLNLYGFRLIASYSLREHCAHHGIRSRSYALWADKFLGEFIGIRIRAQACSFN
jgi:hypothetical protein